MRKTFHVITGIIATISSILFFVCASLSLIVFTASLRVFNSRMYKSALADLQFYNNFPVIVAELLTADFGNSCDEIPIICENIPPEMQACFEQGLTSERYSLLASNKDVPTFLEGEIIQTCAAQYGGIPPNDQLEAMPPFLANLSAESWERIINIVIPLEQRVKVSEEFLDDLLSYLRGDLPEVTISITQIKERLLGSPGDALVLQFLYAQPPCTQEEVDLISMTEGEMPFCLPPDDTLEDLIPSLNLQLKQAISSLPDKLVLLTAAAQSGSYNKSYGEGDAVRLIRSVIGVSKLLPLIPLVFLLLITLLRVRSLCDWMRWWGIPICLTGISVLFFALNITGFVNNIWSSEIAPNLPMFLKDPIRVYLNDLFIYFAHDISERIVIQALVLAILGLAAWIGSYFLKGSRRITSTPGSNPPF